MVTPSLKVIRNLFAKQLPQSTFHVAMGQSRAVNIPPAVNMEVLQVYCLT